MFSKKKMWKQMNWKKDIEREIFGKKWDKERFRWKFTKFGNFNKFIRFFLKNKKNWKILKIWKI